jgi:single-stranded-DNA-specific exonuclease
MASDLGFRIGPRINAAGRLDSATAVVELLNQRDGQVAAGQAAALDQLNQRRRSVQEQLVRQAEDCLVPGSNFGLVWGDESAGWHRGVVGIVAARLRDQIHRPAAVVSVNGEWARGSVRSIPAVHAVEALDHSSDLLERYGGHPAAAGFTIKSDRLPALAERLEDFMKNRLDESAPAPPLHLAARAPLDMIDQSLVRGLLELGPFGKGNPAPVVALEPLQPEWMRPMGKTHLRIGLGQLDAVWWNGAKQASKLRSAMQDGGRIELAGCLGFNTWKGRQQARLTLEDARPETPPDS